MKTIRVPARGRLVAAALTAIFAVCFVAAIIASPWLTRSLVGRPGDWNELSEIGQAYGGISAILSGLALCGIALSLILQRRQIQQSQVMTARERHFELVKIGLENPELLIHAGCTFCNRSPRKFMMCSLWMGHWAMLWDTKAMESSELRVACDDFFANRDAAAWWAHVRTKGWGIGFTSRRKSFLAIVEEAHQACAEQS